MSFATYLLASFKTYIHTLSMKNDRGVYINFPSHLFLAGLSRSCEKLLVY